MMRIQEQYIVPALGVVVLLGVIGLDAALPVRVILAILGLVAVATWLAPPGVQAELRVAIAALGLILLIFFLGSPALWLVLLGLAAIGAMQARHAEMLQWPPRHTEEWARATLARWGVVRTAPSGGGDGEAASGGEGGDAGEAAGGDAGEAASGDVSETAGASAATGAPAMPGGLGDLLRMLKTSPSRLAASLLSAFILLCIFAVPFVILVVSVSAGGETASEGMGYTYRQAAAELHEALGDRVAGVLFVALVAVAVAGLASVVLPRGLVILIGLGGMGMTVISFIWLFVRFLSLSEEAYGVSATALTVPHLGFFVVGGSFFLILVLQLIPGLNRART